MTPPASTEHGNILVTGAAGFVGYHLTTRLLALGERVIGFDNLNDYYDVRLKESRLEHMLEAPRFTFEQGSIDDERAVRAIFRTYRPRVVINLAAQAGVRFSITNPKAYVQSNIVGFFNVLEACRSHAVNHLVYASSSSVYGGNTKVPFEEADSVDAPQSFYAASKRSNELMAATYSHLYGIPATGLRFFTVYGPYGRPDMAYYSFLDAYFDDTPIHLYNAGDDKNDLSRDFTYIDDVTEAIVLLIGLPPDASSPPHRILNVGNSSPVTLTHFVDLLETAVSNTLQRPIRFSRTYEPFKPGDVRCTYASTEKLFRLTGFRPHTPLEVGLQQFTDWYVDYKGVDNAGY